MSDLGFTVPQSDRQVLREMARLPQTSLDRLATAIRSATPRIESEELSAAIAAATDLPRGDVTRYVYVLRALCSTLRELRIEYARFDAALEEILALPASSGHVPPSSSHGSSLTPEQFRALRQLLSAAVEGTSSIALSSKGGDLITDYERVFVRARILSDVRSAFPDSEVRDPQAAVVVHNLRLNYGQRSHDEYDALFLELDLRDLKELRRVIDRAIEKDAVLRRYYGEKVRILEE